MDVTVLAHAGDWIASLIYVVPIVLVGGALLMAHLRERRRDPDADSTDSTGGSET